MGKRGPKADDEFGDQKAVLSTRITQGTRDALEAAAEASGRTLSREVEYRLRRSFDEDEKLVDTLGGRQMFALLRTVSSAMMVAGTGWVSALVDKEKRNVDWISDPEAFDRVVNATNAVLEALRPPGEIREAPKSIQVGDRVVSLGKMGAGLAKLMLQDIAAADGVQPSPAEPMTDVDRLFRRIASDLGPTALGRLKGDEEDGSR